MKFQIQRDRLVDGVNDVIKAVSSRTAIPILSGIKITAHEEGITLTGSDSDISIESFIPKEEDGKEIVHVEETGGIVLQARFFESIVKKLPLDTVEIEVHSHLQTVIRSGKSEFNLNGQDVREYPHLPEIEEDSVLKIPTNLLKTIIRQTVFAVSTSETRPILTGVNWTVEDGTLNCVATDSHRLAMRKAPVSGGNGEPYKAVIPGKSLNELNKILEDTADETEIVMTENQVLFRSKHVLFFSRLLEGNYPDTSRLVPSESKTSMTVGGKEFLQAIDRASLLAREERNNVVKLLISEDGNVQISSNTPEIGKVVEEIQSDETTGEALTISFSAKYMMDALKVLEGTETNIQFTGAMRPFVLRPTADDSILQLITPVRTY
ncbi:DNA polymerase III subunit beta [Jeotgalibacillus aurantiacus]|uniref:DNA polymerase III subunit beta n=1 Tax=Jeotgalibacillus aurantiacus TaxID=2763266 RepID=UPI001D09D3C0|nr:DNA polymerase III subunit beta [Jeotgalibacillus aurantiacus]